MGDEQRAIFALLSGRALVPDEIVGRTEIPARRVNTAPDPAAGSGLSE